jgi:hypothetical protein
MSSEYIHASFQNCRSLSETSCRNLRLASPHQILHQSSEPRHDTSNREPSPLPSLPASWLILIREAQEFIAVVTRGSVTTLISLAPTLMSAAAMLGGSPASGCGRRGGLQLSEYSRQGVVLQLGCWRKVSSSSP